MTVHVDLDDFFRREHGHKFRLSPLGQIVCHLPMFGTRARDSGPWIGGGAIRRAVGGENLGGDIDIFFRDARQFREFNRAIAASLLTEEIKGQSDDRRVAYMWRLGETQIKLDLVRGVFFENVDQLLGDFDFVCCCMATNGVELMLHEYALLDNARRILRVNNAGKLPCSLEHMVRYLRMGFTADDECLGKLLSYGAAERLQAKYEYSGPPTLVEETPVPEPVLVEDDVSPFI